MTKIYTLLLCLLPLTMAFGQIEGTWVMAPQAAALGVGPTIGDISWWSNSADDVDTRACYFDDEYLFNADGTFANVLGDESWIEAWQGVAADGCGVPVAPHDGSNSATWTFDESAGTVTLNGLGAYLGLPKVHNGGEIANSADAVSSITYPVVFSDDDNTMTIDIDYTNGIWHFVLNRAEANNVDELEETQFTFAPNPAGSEISIKSTEAIDQLLVRDLTGKIVLTETNLSTAETVNISMIPTGLYLLEARSGNKVTVKKLLVQ